MSVLIALSCFALMGTAAWKCLTHYEQGSYGWLAVWIAVWLCSLDELTKVGQ